MLILCVFTLLTLIFLAESKESRTVRKPTRGPSDTGRRRSKGMDLGCSFECPAGLTKSANPKHAPTSNGCGSMGVQLKPKFAHTPCCDAHDKCYDTCHLGDAARTGRADCDEAFSQCMRKVCHLASQEERKACLQEMQLMGGGASLLGCAAYQAAQEKACLCTSGESEL